MRVMEVVGYSDIMGVGEDDGGILLKPAGAAPAKMAFNPGVSRSVAQTGSMSQITVQRPSWRDGQLAPGVMAPDEGMVPLGMVPNNGTGIFGATTASITWTGQLQKPYRAERLLVSSVRTGTTATGRLLGLIYVGVDLNMATIQPIDIELFGAPSAFGTRMTLLQAPPGVIISIPVTLSAAPTGGDTIFASIQWSGRVVH